MRIHKQKKIANPIPRKCQCRGGPIDLAPLLSRHNKTVPGSNRFHQQYTLTDESVTTGLSVLADINPLKLIDNDASLGLLLAIHRDDKSHLGNETKEAIRCALESVAQQTVTHELAALEDSAQLSPLLRGPLLSKTVSELVKARCELKQTETCQEMVKQSATCMEERLAFWLESRGIRRWTGGSDEENNNVESGADYVADDFGEQAYYKTEDDIGAEQEAGPMGQRRNTPDFVFVGSDGAPVRVPFLIPVPGKREKKSAVIYVTVLELKGHFVLNGLDSNEHSHADSSGGLARIGHQLKRYTQAFGPTLMLQKWGMSVSSLKHVVSAAGNTVGVLTFEPHALPKDPPPQALVRQLGTPELRQETVAAARTSNPFAVDTDCRHHNRQKGGASKKSGAGGAGGAVTRKGKEEVGSQLWCALQPQPETCFCTAAAREMDFLTGLALLLGNRLAAHFQGHGVRTCTSSSAGAATVCRLNLFGGWEHRLRARHVQEAKTTQCTAGAAGAAAAAEAQRRQCCKDSGGDAAWAESGSAIQGDNCPWRDSDEGSEMIVLRRMSASQQIPKKEKDDRRGTSKNDPQPPSKRVLKTRQDQVVVVLKRSEEVSICGATLTGSALRLQTATAAMFTTRQPPSLRVQRTRPYTTRQRTTIPALTPTVLVEAMA